MVARVRVVCCQACRYVATMTTNIFKALWYTIKDSSAVTSSCNIPGSLHLKTQVHSWGQRLEGFLSWSTSSHIGYTTHTSTQYNVLAIMSGNNTNSYICLYQVEFVVASTCSKLCVILQRLKYVAGGWVKNNLVFDVRCFGVLVHS